MTPTNGRRHAADAISEKGAAPATPLPNKRRRVGNAAAKQKAPSRQRRGKTKGNNNNYDNNNDNDKDNDNDINNNINDMK